MNVFQEICSFLDKHKIEYAVLEHEHCHTAEDAARIRETPLKEGVKAMVMRSKGTFYMFGIAGDKKIDLKKVRKILQTDRISFATPEEVEDITHCVIGSVPPMGNLFAIPVYLDKSVVENEMVVFNAGMHTKSIRMRAQDFVKAVNPEIVDFAQE